MNKKKNRIALINACVNKGQDKQGTELACKYIREYQNKRLYKELDNLNYSLIDFATINEHSNDLSNEQSNNNLNDYHDKLLRDKRFKLNNLNSIASTNRELSKQVKRAIESNEYDRVLVLGGDHSIGLGSLHGTLDAFKLNNNDDDDDDDDGNNVNRAKVEQVGLIWIDAHCDINTPLTTASGNFHGQPLSFLVKEMNINNDTPQVNEFCNWINKTYINASNIVYIGLRDVDPDEVYLLQKYNIKAYSMSDIHEYGIHSIMSDILKNYLKKCTKLHVSVDIDSLDPFYAPSTGTPVLGGLSLMQLMFIGNQINATNKLKTLDLVEVNPLIYSCINNKQVDVEKTVFSAYRTILSFFGYTTMGTYPNNYIYPKPL